MAVNAIQLRRPAERNLYLIAAVAFPLIVLAGYFKSYYFRAFFDSAPPLSGYIVHIHGIVMSAWVLYFVAQIALIRSKNIKLHMTMGMAGIGLAVLAVVTGMAAAYNSNILEGRAPGGINPHSFFLIPTMDMVLFVIYFAAAIYYRKRPAAHKSLMLMTAINFAPAALSRISPMPPEYLLVWIFGLPVGMALAAFGWHTWKHRKFNGVFAAAIVLLIVAFPARLVISESAAWLRFTAWLAS